MPTQLCMCVGVYFCPAKRECIHSRLVGCVVRLFVLVYVCAFHCTATVCVSVCLSVCVCKNSLHI